MSSKRAAQEAANDEAVIDATTYEAMSPGPQKVILAGMFHKDPSLVQAEKTAAEWQEAIAEFLQQPTT